MEPQGEKSPVQVTSYTHEEHQNPHAQGLVGQAQLFQEDESGHVTGKFVLPRPSNDPKDPLQAAFASISYFVFLSNYTTATISPILVPIVKTFGISLEKASYLITFNILFLGLGNLFWIPVSRKIGKRPVLIACSRRAGIWAAKSKFWGSLFAARIIQGFGASASEVLGPSFVADLYFLDERGAKIGFFTLMIALGSAFGGIFGGLVANANADWAWVFWMDSILTAVLVISTIFIQAETNFDRPTEDEDIGLESTQLDAIRSLAQPSWAKNLGVTGWYDRKTPVWWLFGRPISLLRYPAVVWAAVTHRVVLGWVVLQQTANAAYYPALYSYSELAVGNINVTYVVGSLVGCFVGGPASDWMATFISKRRKGYFRPEYRLWCLVPAVIFGPIGSMLWGAGLGKHMNPLVGISGAGITYAVLCVGTAIPLTYIVDSYRPIAGESITILVAFRNTFAFGLSFGVIQCITLDGFLKVAGYMTLIEGIIFLFTIPMYIYGPRLRQWTSQFAI